MDRKQIEEKIKRKIKRKIKADAIKETRYLDRLARQFPDDKRYRTNRTMDEYNCAHFSPSPKIKPLDSFPELAERLYTHLIRQGVFHPGEALNVMETGCGKGVFLKEFKEAMKEKGISVNAFGITLAKDEQFAKANELNISVMDIGRLPNKWREKMHLIIGTRAMYLIGVKPYLNAVKMMLHPSGIATTDHLQSNIIMPNNAKMLKPDVRRFFKGLHHELRYHYSIQLSKKPESLTVLRHG
jgi:hypothetical protein